MVFVRKISSTPCSACTQYLQYCLLEIHNHSCSSQWYFLFIFLKNLHLRKKYILQLLKELEVVVVVVVVVIKAVGHEFGVNDQVS
jgi:hypothetical protein